MPSLAGTARLQQVAERLCAATDRAQTGRLDAFEAELRVQQIDPTDLRWRTADFDPAAFTTWYAQLAPEEQARYCLQRLCVMLLVGIDFETQLIRGLDAIAAQDDTWIGEYCRREAVEEADHSAMFRAFVTAAAPDLLPAPETQPVMSGLAGLDAEAIGDAVEVLAVEDRALFLWSVLCGEEPIDAVQRSFLASAAQHTHPLLEAMCRYHVTDEARHLRFARTYVVLLTREGGARLHRRVELFLPAALDRMTRYILSTPRWFVDRWEVPMDDAAQAAWDERDRAVRARAARKVIDLATTEGLLRERTRPLWSPLLPAGHE